MRYDVSGPRGGSLLLKALGERANRGCRCPLCDHHSLDIDYKAARDTGEPKLLAYCWHCGPMYDDYLRELCRAAGLRMLDVLGRDPAWSHRPRTPKVLVQAPETLPTIPALRARTRALLDHDAAMRWLTEKRGLTEATIKKHRLGYASHNGHDAILIPVIRGNEVIGLRRRYFADSPTTSSGQPLKIVGARGHAAALYPNVPANEEWVLLCEGEFDALVARQNDLPALTTTCGASLPDKLARSLAGRRVLIAYDAGATSQARATQRRLLRDHDVQQAVPIDLGRLGLAHGEDLTDFFVTQGRSRKEFASFVRDEMRRLRRTSLRSVLGGDHGE